MARQAQTARKDKITDSMVRTATRSIGAAGVIAAAVRAITPEINP
jgi:hypothetical protein